MREGGRAKEREGGKREVVAGGRGIVQTVQFVFEFDIELGSRPRQSLGLSGHLNSLEWKIFLFSFC